MYTIKLVETNEKWDCSSVVMHQKIIVSGIFIFGKTTENNFVQLNVETAKL
jgi:hypothetical protein